MSALPRDRRTVIEYKGFFIVKRDRHVNATDGSPVIITTYNVCVGSKVNLRIIMPDFLTLEAAKAYIDSLLANGKSAGKL